MNNYIIDALTNINNLYQSIVAFFYQTINQTQYSNNNLATYRIDYALLLPSSQYLNYIYTPQVSTQIQAYIDVCNTLIAYISTQPNAQNVYVYESIQNTLNDSIVQLNSFAQGLVNAQYDVISLYTVPYGMSLSNLLYINNIPSSTSPSQVKLNPTVADFNNLAANSKLYLTRS